MPEQVRQYVAIDAKSFYASVECVERHLNPLTTHLVVADESRTEKTICLAVSPALKVHGVPGRPRLFEVIQRIKAVNKERLRAGIRIDEELRKGNHPEITVVYFVPDPRKAGGAYEEYTGRVRSIDAVEKCVVFLAENRRSAGKRIRIDGIAEIRGELVDDMEYM